MFDPDYDVFLEIIHTRGISAAARSLGVSPAAISKRLARLEHKLAVRLIHRSTRRLNLTAAGKDLHDTLMPVRNSLEQAERRIMGLSADVAGPLRISAPTSFGRMHLAPCLPAFLDAHASIDLTVDLSDRFVDLLSGEYDLAIRIASGRNPGLIAHRLATSRRVLCAAPSYLDLHGLPQTLDDLRKHRLLAAGGQMPWYLRGPDGEIVFEGASWVRTDSSELVRELTLAGCGIALRSLWDVTSELGTGRLVRVLPDIEGSHDVAIFAVHPPSPMPPPTVQAMIDYLLAHFEAGKAWGWEDNDIASRHTGAQGRA